MKKKQKDLDKLNTYLGRWRGANASFGSYVDTEDRLIIVFERPENAREYIGICFLQCLFISGPTRWAKCNLKCQFCELEDGNVGFEVRDVGSGFALKCAGPIVVGNSELVIPQD